MFLVLSLIPLCAAATAASVVGGLRSTGFVSRRAPLALRFGGRRATAGWSRDRHVVVLLRPRGARSKL